ncbi:unnamed protein product, partial [Prorocentrum cordatum]
PPHPLWERPERRPMGLCGARARMRSRNSARAPHRARARKRERGAAVGVLVAIVVVAVVVVVVVVVPTPPSSGSARSSSGGRRCCKKFGGRRGRGSQASRRREAEARDIGGISETGRRATVAPHRGPCADLRRVSCSRGAIPPRVAQPSTARCRRRPQAPEQGPKVQAFGASAARVEPSRSLGNLSVGPSEAWACAGLAGRCAARALETARAS